MLTLRASMAALLMASISERGQASEEGRAPLRAGPNGSIRDGQWP